MKDKHKEIYHFVVEDGNLQAYTAFLLIYEPGTKPQVHEYKLGRTPIKMTQRVATENKKIPNIRLKKETKNSHCSGGA
jgi:hypothetical protein